MTSPARNAGIGTRVQHLLEQLDGGVARAYAELGLPGFRPRFNPVIRVVAGYGPTSIRDIARALAVTHSAASQTVAQMVRDGLVTVAPGADARQRIVHLTVRARDLLPLLELEWRATTAAFARFQAELPFPLTDLVDAALRALEREPFDTRVVAALRQVREGEPSP